LGQQRVAKAEGGCQRRAGKGSRQQALTSKALWWWRPDDVIDYYVILCFAGAAKAEDAQERDPATPLVRIRGLGNALERFFGRQFT